MLWMSCDPLLYAALNVKGHHPNCHQNFLKAEAGWAPSEVPDRVNFFQNTTVTAQGALETGTALSRAGDAVTLRAACGAG